MLIWRFFRSISNSKLSLLVITGGIVVLSCLVVFVTSSGGGGVGGEEGEDEDKADDISHGMGDQITWVGLKDGYANAEREDKPLMIIIHKSWCGACRSLKPKIKESKELSELSSQFVMVNTMDDDEPPEELYRPDGGYIPRILFFNPKGELMKDVINEEGNPQYKYYYYNVETMISSMNKVIQMFKEPEDIIDQNQDMKVLNADKEEGSSDDGDGNNEMQNASKNDKSEL